MIASAGQTPKTLIEAVCQSSDLDHARDYLIDKKWPDGLIACPECGSTNIGEIKSRGAFQCRERECRKQFSPKTGTIFEASPLPLSKWFAAVWMIANCKNGVSSHEIGRAIGVKQQSAWHVLHRVREAMRGAFTGRMLGECEADATFIGGLAKFMHKDVRERRIIGRGGHDKAMVHGVLKRGGEIRARVVRKGRERIAYEADLVREAVTPGERVYTDTAASYQRLGEDFLHEVINHAISYVEGRVHTNGVENFWSLLKRSLRGSYVSVDPDHLEAYVDEQVFRFNNRKLSDWQRFDRLMGMVIGKRLTYSKLTGGKTR